MSLPADQCLSNLFLHFKQNLSFDVATHLTVNLPQVQTTYGIHYVFDLEEESSFEILRNFLKLNQ